MADILALKLSDLEMIRRESEHYEVGVSEEGLASAERKIWKDFLDSDNIAKRVALREDSYLDLIRPIQEKYDTWWKRVWFPKKDPEFDEHVQSVIASIDGVGVSYPEAEYYTTAGRRRYFLKEDVTLTPLCGVMGAVIAAVGWGLSYLISHSPVYAQMDPISPAISYYGGVVGGPLAGGYMFYTLKGRDYNRFKALINKDLPEQAKIAEEYLRNNIPKDIYS